MIRRRSPALLAVLCAGALALPALAAEAARYTRLPHTPFFDLRGSDAQDSGSAEARHSQSPDSREAARAAEIALAREPYYSSYGEPEPLAPPRSPVAFDDTPWLPSAFPSPARSPSSRQAQRTSSASGAVAPPEPRRSPTPTASPLVLLLRRPTHDELP